MCPPLPLVPFCASILDFFYFSSFLIFLYFFLFFFPSFVSFSFFCPFTFPFPVCVFVSLFFFFNCCFCFHFRFAFFSFPFLPLFAFFFVVVAVVVPPLLLPPSPFPLFFFSSFVSFLFGCLLVFVLSPRSSRVCFDPLLVRAELFVPTVPSLCPILYNLSSCMFLVLF